MNNSQKLNQVQVKPRTGFFYGWWIVIACFLISLCTSGVILMGFTVFFEPIAQTFNWSYAQVSLAASIQVLLFAIMSPISGIVADKWGARKLIFGGIILVCLGLFLVSRSTSLWMFYLTFALASIGFGACGSMGLTATVVHWFKRKVSLAIGITTSGLLTGGVLIPLITYLVDSFEWTNALVYISIGLLILLIPLTLLIRRSPEDYGLLPDGDTKIEDAHNQHSEAAKAPPFHMRKIFKNRTFWLITISYFFFFSVINSTTVHIMPYLTTINMDRSTASLVASGMSVFSLLGSLGLGWLGDRLKRRILSVMAFAALVISMLLLGYLSSAGLLILVIFVILFAFGLGGGVTMLSGLVSEYFDKRNFGSIAGFTLGIAQLFGSIGAPLTGLIYDKFNTYQGIWYVYAGMLLIPIILLFILPAGKITAES